MTKIIRLKQSDIEMSSGTITDPALARAITRRAATIYSAFTGRELSDE